MLLCLYRHPSVTPDVARLGVVQEHVVIDVHLACLVSMAGHMKIRRAQEIAAALAPPDMVGFVEGGRHSWNALSDSLERLGGDIGTQLVGPAGEAVVVRKAEVRLVPMVPPAAGWSSQALGEWDASPLRAPGSDTIIALHTDGQAYLPEYLAIIGTAASEVGVDDALAHVGAVSIVHPSKPESACLLRRMPVAVDGEDDLEETIARAVAGASERRTLYAGDIVRCGPPMVSRAHAAVASDDIDLTEFPETDVVDISDISDILPSR